MPYLLIALIGVFGGLASGFFGVGGGLIFVPLLILFLKMDTHVAIGTSLLAIVPTALVGAVKHAAKGAVDWKIAVLLFAFAMIGAWFGATLSLHTDTVLLRRIFAGFLFLLSLKMFFLN